MSADSKAALYDQMRIVAEANGFKSLTEAVAVAVQSRELHAANDRYVSEAWTCECGSQVYNLTPTGAVCFVCAKPATEWVDG